MKDPFFHFPKKLFSSPYFHKENIAVQKEWTHSAQRQGSAFPCLFPLSEKKKTTSLKLVSSPREAQAAACKDS